MIIKKNSCYLRSKQYYKMTCLADFKGINTNLKLKILKMYWENNAGHIGSSLSCIDLMHSILANHKTQNDVFILSKGHAAASLYASMNTLEIFSDAELKTYYKDGSKLPAHPAALISKDIPFATGSLGHGFPIACGIAKAKQLKNEAGYIFVLLSDGETNEGTTWEAAHFAAKHELSNLIVIIDKNKIQGFDYTSNVLGDTAKASVFNEIGFEIIEIDGHNLAEIDNCLENLKTISSVKPKMIIANTVKGKGISFMENTVDWHYWPMTDELYKQAVKEISEKE